MQNTIRNVICGSFLLMSSFSSAFGKAYLVWRDATKPGDVGTRLEIVEAFAEHGMNALTISVTTLRKQESEKYNFLLTWSDVKGHNDKVRSTLRGILVKAMQDNNTDLTILAKEDNPNNYHASDAEEILSVAELWQDDLNECGEQTVTFAKFVEQEFAGVPAVSAEVE